MFTRDEQQAHADCYQGQATSHESRGRDPCHKRRGGCGDEEHQQAAGQVCRIRHIGVSNVDEDQLRTAQALTPVVSTQNRYNLKDRTSETLIDLCEQESLVFLPWAPIQQADDNTAIAEVASRRDITTTQVVLA
ncbi:MAG: aldo/keto reductase [Actinomycetota bacterium]|nr:aldo/keto reductase [Actinomycetota bacterium]